MSDTGLRATGTAEETRPATRPSPGQVGQRRRLSRDQVENSVLGVLKWGGVVFFLAITVLPFYYMFMLSLRSIESLALDPGALFVSLKEASLAAYRNALGSVDSGGQGFLLFLRNSGLIAVASVIASLAVAIPGAYAIARLEFFGRRQVHSLFLAIYLFPSILLAIPLFVLFTRIGLRGSLFGLIIVYTSQTVPVTIHMLRNYFETVPASLEEAAAVDGATRLQIIRKIALPLAKPAIMATGLIVFMVAWNEFLFALLFLVERREVWTVSLGLSQLAGSIEVPKTILMAGAVILTLPIIALFFATERLLVEGLTAGGEKG
jgi:multiple sugar transport system permease protein